MFIALLAKLAQVYAHAKVIHVILDNYRIHHSLITRLWQDLHAEVTRNHRCASMDELMQNRAR